MEKKTILISLIWMNTHSLFTCEINLCSTIISTWERCSVSVPFYLVQCMLQLLTTTRQNRGTGFVVYIVSGSRRWMWNCSRGTQHSKEWGQMKCISVVVLSQSSSVLLAAISSVHSEIMPPRQLESPGERAREQWQGHNSINIMIKNMGKIYSRGC